MTEWPETQAASLEYLNDLANQLGINWFDYQWEAFLAALSEIAPNPRRCLFYKTGAGKSVTSLVDMKLWNQTEVLVIAPPATHPQWEQWGRRLEIDVECMSHAKFRMKSTKLSRTKAIVADEVHLFGGHKGQGWKKLDRLAGSLQAPLILASATPNYNDAERVYCIQHILDPWSCRGGFIQFLYDHCITEPNPFGMEPIVTGFRNYPNAAAYLAALPGVDYLPDDLVYQIVDIPVQANLPPELETYGLNDRAGRIIASDIEGRHARVNLALITDDGKVREDIYEVLADLVGAATTPSLVFAAHSTVAEALGVSLRENEVRHAVVTGGSSARQKDEILSAFKAGQFDVLVGTATLATGPDGLDKVCDQLIILDDTDDDSLRRQLIGRIMPRGTDTDATRKSVHRLVLI